MTNLIINKIYEKLIKISRIKDNMNYCEQESKNLYKKEIKYLTDEIKLFLDELSNPVQQETDPSDLLPIPEISCTEEGYVKIKIPFIFRNSIVDFNKFSKVLSKYLSVFLKKDIEFPFYRSIHNCNFYRNFRIFFNFGYQARGVWL